MNGKEELCYKIDSWAFLASGAFLTACYNINFLTVYLLRRPAVFTTDIQQGPNFSIKVPEWFPYEHSVIESEDGKLYGKIKDYSLIPAPTVNISPTTGKDLLFDLSYIPGPRNQKLKLTYSPWHRFYTEPYTFDIAGKVAAFAGNAFSYLFRHQGLKTDCAVEGDTAVVTTDSPVTIRAKGMSALKQISIHSEDSESCFDLDRLSISLRPELFPNTYKRLQGLLELKEPPRNTHVFEKNGTITLSFKRGAADSAKDLVYPCNGCYSMLNISNAGTFGCPICNTQSTVSNEHFHGSISV